jgi:guanylate kinase
MEPVLKHYSEFRDILAKYHMSDRAKKALEGIKFVLMVAPTSTGRNTIIQQLVESKDYYFIVSDTTRPPQMRDGQMERTGKNYFFRTEEELLEDLKAGEFLEAAIIHEQQVSGISIRELERAKLLYKTAITDIEPVGADIIMRTAPLTKAIFLVPPSFDVWQNRLRSRGSMSQEELRNRLTSAAAEFKAALEHDYYNIVITDKVDHTAAVVDAIAQGKPNIQQGRGIEIIHDLQYQLEQKIESMKFV